MILYDTFNYYDFISLLNLRLYRYGEVLHNKAPSSRLGQSPLNELFKNDLTRLVNDFQLINGEIWGYGINYIKIDDIEYKNLDIEEIRKIDELNKHQKYPMLNLIIFSIKNFDFKYNMIQLNTIRGKFIAKGLEKISIDGNINPKFEIISPKIFISIESTHNLKFQLDTNLSLFLKSTNKYANGIIEMINLKKQQSEKLNAISLNYSDDIFKALSVGNIDEFIKILKTIFSTIPYQIQRTYENFYHAIFHVIILMINRRTNSEISEAAGRIDTLVELKNYIYIFEFKMTNPNEAMKQIHDKKYYEPYLYHGKQIILVGIAFDEKAKNIKDYKTEIK